MGDCFCTGACRNGGRCPASRHDDEVFAVRAKPRIAKRGKVWVCRLDSHSAEAATPGAAYDLWCVMAAFSRAMQKRLDERRKWPLIEPQKPILRFGGKTLRERIGYVYND